MRLRLGLFAAVVLALCVALLPAGSALAADTILQPDKLIILSTTDVKGKTSPCG